MTSINLDEVLTNSNTLAFLEQYGNSFRVTALPDDVRDHPEASHFYLYVEYRSPGRWAVLDYMRNKVLSDAGE